MASTKALAAFLPGALIALATPAHAAGGHHAVDDAAMLEPGQCQAETWLDRESGGARRLLHVGPACRIGPVELGLNFDRSRPGAGIGGGPQLKWATALNSEVSVGVLVAASWVKLPSQYGYTSVVIPVSWQATEQVALHVNAGRDFRAGMSDISRSGVALEWAPNAAWSTIAERWRENTFNYVRVGGRWNVSPALSVDLSRARSVGNGPSAWWTLGVTVMFGQ